MIASVGIFTPKNSIPAHSRVKMDFNHLKKNIHKIENENKKDPSTILLTPFG